MASPILSLGELAVAGLTPSVAILGLRHQSHQRWQLSLETYRLRLSGDIEPSAIESFLSGLSAVTARRLLRPVTVRALAVEIVATEVGIEHYLVVGSSERDTVVSHLRASLPNVGFEPVEDLQPTTPSLAAELLTSKRDLPLSVDRPAATSSAILAALQPLTSGEAMRVQYVIVPLGHGHPPEPASLFGLEHLWGARSAAPTQSPKAVRDKFSRPLVGVSIRLGVASRSRVRDRQLMNRLVGAFHAANSEHAHLRRRVVGSRRTARLMAARTVPLLGCPGRLSSAELVGLLALPAPGVSLPGLQLGGARELAPSSAIARRGRVIADATYPGSARPLALSVQSSLMHVHVMGPSGGGKSTLLANLFAQDVAVGHGAVLLDPKVDLARDVLDLVPLERDVIVLDPTDERPVGLDLFAGGVDDPELVSERILSVMHRLYLEFWGPRTDDILRHALLSLVRIPGATFTELPRLLIDPSYRQWVVGQLDDPISLGPFWSGYEALSPAERAQAIGPVLNKLRAVVARPRLRRILGQSGATIDFDDILATTKLLVVPLSAGTLGEDAAALLGSFVLAQLWASIQRRVRLTPANRPPVFVFLDEFQVVTNLASPLPDVLAQSRAMGVGFHLAHQHLDQLGRATREAVMANCRSQIIFQTSAGDARRMAPEFAPYLSARDLQGLRPYEVAMTLAADGGVAPPVTGRTRPAPKPLGFGDQLRERSRQRYGRDATEIDAELRRRYETPADAGPVGRKRSGQ